MCLSTSQMDNIPAKDTTPWASYVVTTQAYSPSPCLQVNAIGANTILQQEKSYGPCGSLTTAPIQCNIHLIGGLYLLYSANTIQNPLQKHYKTNHSWCVLTCSKWIWDLGMWDLESAREQSGVLQFRFWEPIKGVARPSAFIHDGQLGPTMCVCISASPMASLPLWKGNNIAGVSAHSVWTGDSHWCELVNHRLRLCFVTVLV